MTLETTLQYLEALRQSCEARMLTYTGSGGMCQLHKDGRVTGGLKYQEGRLVVLGSLIRQLKQGTTADVTTALAASLTTEGEKWQAQLARYQAQARPAITWLAYCQGGVDTIAEIRQHLEQNTPQP